MPSLLREVAPGSVIEAYRRFGELLLLATCVLSQLTWRSPTLKMEVVCYSETLLILYYTVWRYILYYITVYVQLYFHHVILSVSM
jgi:hypothetical protein